MSHTLPQFCIYGILVLNQDSVCGMHYANLTNQWKTCDCICVTVYATKQMAESRILVPGHKILDSTLQFECPGRLSQEK